MSLLRKVYNYGLKSLRALIINNPDLKVGVKKVLDSWALAKKSL